MARALTSVLTQSYRDFEIVVCDDSGSARRVVERFGDPRIRYYRNPRRLGPATNLTRTIELAHGSLLAILNDDDRWEPGFLASTAPVFDTHPDVGIVFTDDFFEIGTRRIRRRLPFAPGRQPRFLRSLLEHSFPASASLMRRAVWEQGERRLPIDASMVGDATTWMRAADDGWPFFYVEEPLAVLELHPGQVSWSEEALSTRMLNTFLAFRFQDPVSERLRRARVAELYFARAHTELRHRRLAAARADIARAVHAAPASVGLRSILALTGVRGAIMRWGAAHPQILVVVLETWRRARLPILPRQRISCLRRRAQSL